TRMLILGSQILVGFNFHGFFQPGFNRLPPAARELEVIGLGLMLAAVGLLISPGAFHQIVERGNDSPGLLDFAGHVASFALLPFALGIGIDVYVATVVVVGEPLALP